MEADEAVGVSVGATGEQFSIPYTVAQPAHSCALSCAAAASLASLASSAPAPAATTGC